MIYVIDASVACRFLLIEELSEKAELVLESFLEGKCDLKAPKLIIYEAGNALWKAANQGLIEPEEAVEKLSYLVKLKIDSIELDERMHKNILMWSIKNNATYYDGAYVISSKTLGAPLLTADNTLYEKASKEVPTLHLREWCTNTPA